MVISDLRIPGSEIPAILNLQSSSFFSLLSVDFTIACSAMEKGGDDVKFRKCVIFRPKIA